MIKLKALKLKVLKVPTKKLKSKPELKFLLKLKVLTKNEKFQNLYFITFVFASVYFRFLPRKIYCLSIKKKLGLRGHLHNNKHKWG